MVLVEFQLPIPVSLLFSIFLLLPPVQRLCFPHPRLTPTSQPGFIPIRTPPPLSPEPFKPSFSYGPKTLPRADVDSSTLCKSVAPLLRSRVGLLLQRLIQVQG
ncbi:hypothetical protein F5051DRAFT_36217 [Lentinula edodes]|nr:hypothetical protein F5051DRAFT_36217 [Lentinula edodes]